MEEYAAASAYDQIDRSGGGRLGAPRPTRPLDGIAAAADRLERTAIGLEDFLGRYHGHGETASANVKSLPPASYSGNLERLANAVDRLDKLAAAVAEIG